MSLLKINQKNIIYLLLIFFLNILFHIYIITLKKYNNLKLILDNYILK